jgi:hypothetical protein
MTDISETECARRLELYEGLVGTLPGVKRKGATMPYTSLNGHMYSFLSKEGELCLRLPSEARQAFLERYETELCVQHGVVMKEYVRVPTALLVATDELAAHFADSFAYVAILKPKPSKKK